MLTIGKRKYKHITSGEAHCPCGCGLLASDWLLNLAEAFIEQVGSPTKITCMDRCKIYNKDLGGYKLSPHILHHVLDNPNGYGAIDFSWKGKSRAKQTKMILVAFELYQAKIINHIEIANGHIHIARVPDDHPCARDIHPGRSK